MFTYVFLIFIIISAPIAMGSESFSYSGRIVTNSGAPVPGPAKLTFDLTYSDQPGVILCSQVMDGVELVNGVFHVKLNFPTCNLPNIFKNTPANHTVSIRVTDNTAGGSKVYSYQAIHSVPYSFVSQTSKQLDSMNADAGEVLTWDGTKWTPVDPSGLVTSSAPSGAAGGALTGTYPNPGLAPIAQSNIVNLVSDLSSKIGLGQLSATLPLVYNNSTGVFSLDNSAVDKLDDLEVLPPGDGLLERSSGILVSRTCDSGEVLKWFSPAGWTCSEDSAEDSDKLPLIGGTLTGDLILETQLQIKNGISNSIVIKSPGSNTNYTLILPPNVGGANQVLTTDGAGVLTWETPATSATPSGPAGGVLNGTYPNPGLNDIPQSKVTNLVTDLDSKIGLGDLSVTAPLIYNSGAFSISEATTSAAGTLSATDKTKLDSLEALPGAYGLIERWSGGLRSLTCAPNEVLKWNGTIWACAADDDIDETKLPLTGGTLTGNLLLPGAPSDNQHATTKSYVDTLVSNNASKWATATGGINYAGGNVGIGTSSPAQKLEVHGHARVVNNAFQLYNSAAPTNDRLWSIGNATTEDLHFMPRNDDGSPDGSYVMTMQRSGNIGIGTSTPEQKLQIGNPDDVFKIGKTTDSYHVGITGNQLGFNRAGPSYIRQSTVGGSLRVQTSNLVSNDTNAIEVISNGNVGIGITIPTSKLHVEGDIAVTGDIKMAGGDSYIWTNGTGTGYTGIYDQANNRVLLYASESTGNVGVGKNNPQAKLDVAGTVAVNGNMAIVWQELATPLTIEFAVATGVQTITLTGVPVGARYILADVFATMAAADHQNFILGRGILNNQSWVNTRGQQPSAVFGDQKFHAVRLNYTGDSDGYSSNYGTWYSSQHIPINTNSTMQFLAGGNNGTAGWIYIVIRGYSL